jgi:hypothetical protein
MYALIRTFIWKIGNHIALNGMLAFVIFDLGYDKRCCWYLIITNKCSIIRVISLFGDGLPMDLKELKKYADTMDDNGKRELISFLQSRTKGIAVPVRAIDESRNIKMGLFARIAKTILSYDLGSTL